MLIPGCVGVSEIPTPPKYTHYLKHKGQTMNGWKTSLSWKSTIRQQSRSPSRRGVNASSDKKISSEKFISVLKIGLSHSDLKLRFCTEHEWAGLALPVLMISWT